MDIRNECKLAGNGKKNDYWYVDRRGGPRAVWIALVLSITALGAACCANNDQTFQQQYQAAYGDNATRGTSDLLGSVTSTVASTVDGTVTAVAGVLQDVTVVLSSDATRNYYAINCLSTTLKTAQVVTAAGEVLKFDLTSPAARIAVDNRKAVNFVYVTTTSGGKWYFDNAGNWLPGGYKPSVAARVQEGKWYIDSGDAIDKVIAYYANGNTSTLAWSAAGIAFPRGAISYVAAKLRYDNSKWYFDNAGLPLPNGYTPVLNASIALQAPASTLLAATDAAPAQLFNIASSDLYDTLSVRYADGTVRTTLVSAMGGTYNLGTTPVLRVGLRIKSDGSKWYFDNSSGKWFSDCD